MKSSNDIEERMGNIYASEESLKAHVRKMEERFVRSMKEPDQEESPRELESNIEWFLTWRLKLTGPPTVMCFLGRFPTMVRAGAPDSRFEESSNYDEGVC